MGTSLCGAGVAHSLGKGEATGSNPVKGKFKLLVILNEEFLELKTKYG